MERSNYMIVDVPKEAKRLLKIYAAKHNLKLGDALLKMAKEVERNESNK